VAGNIQDKSRQLRPEGIDQQDQIRPYFGDDLSSHFYFLDVLDRNVKIAVTYLRIA